MTTKPTSPAVDPTADEPTEADYADEFTDAVAALLSPPDVALAHQRLEAALNAHLGGGVEVRADGSIAIASHLIMVETGDLVATGKVVIRARSDVIREWAERRRALGAARRILMGGDESTEAGGAE